MQDLPLLNAQNEKGASQLRKKYGNDDADTVGWFSTNLLGPLSGEEKGTRTSASPFLRDKDVVELHV